MPFRFSLHVRISSFSSHMLRAVSDLAADVEWPTVFNNSLLKPLKAFPDASIRFRVSEAVPLRQSLPALAARLPDPIRNVPSCYHRIEGDKNRDWKFLIINPDRHFV